MADPVEEAARRRRENQIRGVMRDDRSLASRTVTDLGNLMRMLPRALIEMVGAPLSDAAALARPREDTGRLPTATGNLAKEWAKSAGRTALDIGAGQSIFNAIIDPSSISRRDVSLHDAKRALNFFGADSLAETLDERALQRYEMPVSTAVEDLGNVAISGAIAGRVGSAAALSRAGLSGQVAPYAHRLRPIAGRHERLRYRQTVSDLARRREPAPTHSAANVPPLQARLPAPPGSPVWQDALQTAVRPPRIPGQRTAGASLVLRDVIGHPYQQSMMAAGRLRTPGGGTLGESVKSHVGRPLLDEFYDRFPNYAPDAREARRLHQELVREEVRDARMGALDRFDPHHAIPDLRQAVRKGMDRFEPGTLEALGHALPDRTILDRIRGQESITDAQLLDIIKGVQELHAQGRSDVMPAYASTEGQLRLAMARLSLEEARVGLPQDALLDLVPWMERLDHGLAQLRINQRALREQGFTTEQIRDLYGGSERFILDERLLDPRIDRAFADPDVSAAVRSARESWRRFNDPEELSQLKAGRIPQEGTRFRWVEDPETGQVRYDPQTGEVMIRRVAEPTEPVPFETQGPSRRQAGALRRQRRRVEGRGRQVERARERLADQQMEAQAELADLERTLAREIETLTKRAVAEGDSPQASRLWTERDQLWDQYEALQAGKGPALPERLRRTMDEVSDALDEIIALSTTPAIRQMLTPETYTRITDAAQRLRGAEEFLDTNMERMRFFDALDQIDRRQLRRDGGISRAQQQLAAERRAASGEGRRMSQAQREILRRRREMSRAEGGAEPLFDSDAAVSRLENAIDSFLRARRPYRESLLKRQTRARDALARHRRAERSLANLEEKLQAAQAQMMQSIEAQPAPVRDVLWLERIADNMSNDLDRLVTEGIVDPAIRDQLDLRGLPRMLEEVTGSADARLWGEIDAGTGAFGEPGFDISYVPDFVARPEGARAPASAARVGPVVREASTLQRRAGGDAPLEQSFRQIVVRRITDLRVEEFLTRFADEIETKFGRTQESILREIAPDEATLSTWLGEPAKAARELSKLGYAEFRPTEFFPFRQRRTAPGLDPQAPRWIKKELEGVIRGMSQDGMFPRFLREMWDPMTTSWKRVVLALRPAWHVYNAMGNMTMSLFIGGVSVADAIDFMPVAVEAWRRSKHGYGLSGANLDALPLGRWGRGSGQRLREAGVSQLPDLPGDPRRTLFSQGLTRRELHLDYRQSGLAAMAERLPGWEQAMATRGGHLVKRSSRELNRITSASYRANAAMDDLWRATVYLARTMRHGDSPQVASTRVMEALGNYQKMTPFEKNYIRSAYPFYAWVRHISTVFARGLRPDSITRTLILGQVTQILGEPNEFEEMLPGYATGDVHLGQTADGTPIFLGTYGLNPFTDVTQPFMQAGYFNPFAGAMRGAHPVPQIIFEQGTGLSTMTGRPFSTPVPRRDLDGRAIPTPPPLSEQLIRTIPHLTVGRDIYRGARGAPRLRYGTGEPLFIPGATTPPVASRIGQMMGANIRPIDVESMHARKIKNRYEAMRQAMRYEGQLERMQER